MIPTTVVPRRIHRFVIVSLIGLECLHAQFFQQGGKLVGSGGIGAQQGYSIALSSDGNTALVGGQGDGGGIGAAWVFVRSNGKWTQQGSKLLGTGGTAASQGYSVALSADGNTALLGGPDDNYDAGAAWVFTRSNGTWTQQGSKLVGSGATASAQQGSAVALSADGNTALIGGPGDDGDNGAVWVFTRSNGVWSQQGNKLVGMGASGSSRQGHSVALSADGNTALAGGPFDDTSLAGAVWVFTRSNATWTQQGNKLVGTGATLSTGQPPYAASQGGSVALSADGNTALVGGSQDNGAVGALWVYTRSNGVWTQQGSKLVGMGEVGSAALGASVALSADGDTALTGGPGDNSSTGAAWVYTRSNGAWTQQGNKLVGTRAAGSFTAQGFSVALSASGLTAIEGGNLDNGATGAVWVFQQGTFASAGNPQSTPTGAAFSFPLEVTVTDVNGNYVSGNTITFSGDPTLVSFSSTTAMTDATGRASVTATATGLAGSYIVTATNAGGGSAQFVLSNVNTALATGSCIVTNTGDDNTAGTLRFQVASCGRGGTITFAAGAPNVSLAQTQDIQLTQDLTIDGGTGGVTLDANSSSRIFFIKNGNITLKNLTLQNGVAKGGNGGSNTKAGGGAAGMGGAVFVNAGALLTNTVTFFNDIAQGGNGGPAVSNGVGATGGGGGVGGDGGGTPNMAGNGGGGGDFGSSGGTGLDGSGGTSTAAGFGGGSGTANAGFGSGGGSAGNPGVFGGMGNNSTGDGGGGAGLGGAIFVRNGLLLLNGATFLSNSANQGSAGGAASNGQGKGGALYLSSQADGRFVGGMPTFTGDLATDAGINTACSNIIGTGATDSNDLCGILKQASASAPTADSVTPTSGSGTNRQFTFKFSSVNGFNYLNGVSALINSSLNGAGACWVFYEPASNLLYLYNDNPATLSGPITLGGGTLNNSQCTINGSTSAASGSVNTLTLNLSVSFKTSVLGPRNTYGWASDYAGATSGWQQLGTWTPTAFSTNPPTADSVAPTSGSGLTQSFTFKYSSVNGYTYLSGVSALINNSLNGAGACWVYYDPVAAIFYLYNDTGTGFVNGALSNSQCTVNTGSSSAGGTGNTLTVVLSVTFNASVLGTQNVYGFAIDDAGKNSTWTQLGTWTPGALSTSAPTADSVAPASGSGLTQSFTFKYSSANGYKYLSGVSALVNKSLNGAGACWVYYDAVGGVFYLYNNAGTGFVNGALSNSQCTINTGSSSASGTGNTLSLVLSITFASNVIGTQNVYGYSIDKANRNSTWTLLGTWTPATAMPTAPTADSVSPNSGSGSTQSFTFKYSSVNGYQYLHYVSALFNSGLNGAGACWVVYDRSSSAFYLYNDAGTGFVVGSLTNTQCTINSGSSSASGSGNTLSLILSVTFKAAFTGSKNDYGYAIDNANLNSTWTQLGTWTVH